MDYRPHQPRLSFLAAGIATFLGFIATTPAQDGLSGELQPRDARKLPSFKLTMPAAPELPVQAESEPPPPVAKPVKQKDFFGAGVKPQKLSLSAAIQSALNNNLDAKIEEIGVLVEEARVRNAYGDYDPIFSFSAIRSGAEQPDNRGNISSADAVAQLQAIEAQIDAINANTLANQQFTNAILQALGRPTRTFNTPPLRANLTSNDTIIFDQDLDRADLAIQARSPIGTIVRAGVRTTRVRSTFEGDERTIVPTYTASTTIEARQPLLKDFGLDANLADIRISRKNRDAQELAWKFRLEATLQRVVATYYEMLFGMADLENKGDAIVEGLKLVAHTQRRKELGFLSPYEVQQAQVQLSFDRENLLLAKNTFLDRQFAIQRLIEGKFQETKRAIYLPVHLPSLRVPKLDRAELLSLAFQKRLDLRAAIVAAETEDIRVKFAKNQRLPQLDIVGSYGWTGLDTEGYNTAFERMTHSQAPNWQLGITGSFPIGGIQPRAQLDAALARKDQAIYRIRSAELEVGISVDSAIELIRTNQQRLETARFTTKTAEEAVRVGFRRMEEGLISNFDLIEQQRRLYEARTRELAAVAELNRAITQLWLATGTVLENLGITFSDDAQPAPVKKAAKKK